MGDESIIEVIQKMVQEGQPREKIIGTLHDLGVNDDQAKKLLLIAEADTFTLLKKEINHLVKESFDEERKNFEEIIHADLQKIEDEEKGNVRSMALSELGNAKQQIIDESKNFEDKINKTISSSQKTVQMVKVALDTINEKISTMELDIEQIKVHKFRKKSMVFSYAMLSMGAILLFVALFAFFMTLEKLDNSLMLMIGIIIIASITLMFASIIG